MEKNVRTGKTPLYVAMWRWHFYAGVVVLPLMLLLSVTGMIYLFKAEFEEWWYRDLLTVQPGTHRMPAERLVEIARAAHPDKSVMGYSPAANAQASARVLLGPKRKPAGEHADHDGAAPRKTTVFNTPPSAFERPVEVYLDPYRGTVLGTLYPEDRPMQVVRNLHGKLLAGTTGELIVETASGWMAMLLVSGIYLWWPRTGNWVWGTLLPRLSDKRRTFWKDMHAVPAFYTTVLLVFILATGLPWTVVAGGAIKLASGSSREGPAEARADRFHSQPIASHSGSVQDWFASFPEALGTRLRSIPPAKPGQLSLEHVAVIAEANGLPHPFQIASPRGPQGVYSVRTLPRDPRQTMFLHVDQYSGEIRGSFAFDSMNPVAKTVSMGIALHEGRLFGFWNQMLGVLACLGTFTLSIAAGVMWWQRRPEGRLGAPRMMRSFQLPRGIVALSAGMSVIFPVTGLSLLSVLVFDRWILPRFPRLRWVLAE
ncbi:MAG: PepSY domain-containing protein [Bryobacterales bacterium]|nr:PepSY domain-containing protein [Bryobacterales bacterium]